MNITYHAPSSSMGNLEEHQADKFRQWARKEIESRYPGYVIDVSLFVHAFGIDALGIGNIYPLGWLLSGRPIPRNILAKSRLIDISMD